MVEWVRRSPQGPGNECAISPQAPSCANVQSTTAAAEDSAPEVVATTSPAITAPEASATDVAGVYTTVITTTGTNRNGQVWTNVHTTLVTDAPTASPSTTTSPATLTQVPSSAEATSKSTGNNGVSKDAVAGIAIGTCIAGAAIAFIIAWLLFKRRDRKLVQKTCPSGYPIYADSSPELVMVQKSAAEGSPYVQVAQTQMRTPVPVPTRVPVPAPQPGASDSLAGILPPAANEHDVRTRVSSLFDQIHRHIDLYYRDVHASITPSMNSDLASFGKDVDLLELLQNCSSPTVALKHALVAFIIGTTGPKSEGFEQTVWPDELSRTLSTNYNAPASSISPASVRDAQDANHGFQSDPSQLATAQSLHRRLTVYLYTVNNSLTSTNRSQSRLSNLSALSLTRKTSSAIREAAELFSLTFFPWANPTFGDQDREGDLVGIIGEALECRIWLCGQMGEWGFEWEGVGRGAVVVSPALIVRDMGGPRRVVMDQSVVGI